jgi:hypothetical protein
VEPPTEAEGEYPNDWFGLQRAFPVGRVNQEAYQQSLEWMRAERATGFSTTQSSLTWSEAGPFNTGGRVTALAIAPGGTTLYAGAAAGGVFKSTDSGVNWSSSFDQVLSIGALALDPTNALVVYVGTGEANAATDNYDGAGVFRTGDGGQSWAYLGLQETRRIARVAVDPAAPSRLFVAAMGAQFTTGPDRGLYRSEDSGQHWSKVLYVNDSTGVCDVVINPAHPETVYCASWERIRRPTYRRTYGPGCGIWRSVDHGTTWTRLQNGLPAASDHVGRIGLGLARTRPSTIYAQIVGGIAESHNGLGFYRSVDGGVTWARRDTPSGFTGSFGGFGWYFGDMTVDPNNPDEVYCCAQSFIRSTDGGVNFTALTGNAHVDFHAIWVDPLAPAHLYAGTDGGFWATSAGGANWTTTSNLPITQFYAGAIDASNPARLLGGAQDNGSNMTSGSPYAWFQILGGDGFYCAVDPTNSNVVFAEYQNMSSGQGPFRSTNGGSSFATPSGFVSSDRYNWNAPFTMDPSNHNVLLAGSNRVYRSVDNGVSYTVISEDLTTNHQVGNLAYSTISTLAIAPSNSSYYYVGTDDGQVWRSKVGGGIGNWQNVTAGLPLRWVTRVTPDRIDPEVVYVTLSGYNQDDFGAHVFRSTNAGDTWTAIDGNLPDSPANDLLTDPLESSRLFLATDVGVFTTSDLGVNWSPLGTALPAVPVVDLSLDAGSRTLVAATHGRSQWKFALWPVGVAVGEPSATARLALSGPTPNPSRSDVRFILDVSRPGHANATIYDAMGRRVATLLDGSVAAERRALAWNGRDDAGRLARAGAYYLRVALDHDVSLVRRIVRID